MKRIRDLDVASAIDRVAAFSLRRAAAVVAAVAALALLGVLLASTLDPSASSSTLAGRGTASSKATAELHRKFGEEPIVVLVRGRLTGVLLTQDVARLLGLEGCISGNAPPGARAPAPVCRELARLKPVRVVYGPGTFVNEAASRILDQLGIDPGRRERDAARADRRAREDARRRGLKAAGQERAAQRARQQVDAAYAQQALQLSLRYGLNGVPALNNPEFVLQLVFDPALGAEVPKPRFSYVFPNKNAGVIQARLRPGLSHAERKRAIAMVKEAVASPAFKLKFGSYAVSGSPVVTEAVASSLPGTLLLVLAVVVLLIAAALVALYRGRPRLLPLALALAAAAVSFGLAALAGASLTIASVAALPVLLALAVSCAMQLQDRPDRRPNAGPAIALAGLATAVGLLALVFSPVPMVRTFGALAALGIPVVFAIAITAGVAARSLPRPSLPSLELPWLRTRFRGSRVRRWGRAAFDQALARPRRVLWIGVGIALLGVLATSRLDVESELTQLAPQDRHEVRDLKELRRETGVSGDVSVLVHAADLADPRAIAWMADYQRRVLKRHGYRDGRPCRGADLCPALSLTNFLGGRPPRTPAQAKALFQTLPGYFSQNVITPDRRTANVAFGIRAMPLDEQKRLIDDMRAQLDPPAGVTAELAGPPVVEAETDASLRSSRWTLPLAALLAVFLVLVAAYRRFEPVLAALVPAGLAACWSGLVLFLLPFALDPLSVTVGALAVAISSSLCVLLTVAYREQRAGGVAPRAAIEGAYGRLGGVLLASNAAVVAGFAALIASDFEMLRDFGVAAAVDLTIVLAATMVVLPATLLVSEEGWRAAAAGAITAAPRQLRRALPAARRRLRASAPFRK
jgi:uncharacterized protein